MKPACIVSTVLGLVLAACSPVVGEQRVTQTQVVELEPMPELEILVIYDNDINSPLWGALDNGSGVLLHDLMEESRPWRYGYVSAYPTEVGQQPEFLGVGYTDHTEDNPNDTLKPAIRDVHDFDHREPQPVDAMIAFLNSDAFAGFHRPNATLNVSIFSGRDDASQAEFNQMFRVFGGLDTGAYLSVPHSGDQGCENTNEHSAVEYPPAPRLAELAADDRVKWSESLCVNSWLGYWGEQAVLGTPGARPNTVLVDLDYEPYPETIVASRWTTDGEWVDLPPSQVQLEGPRQVRVTGPLEGTRQVRVQYTRDVLEDE